MSDRPFWAGIAACLAGVAGCSSQTLVVVGSCPDASSNVCPDAAITGPLREGLVGLWHLDETAGSKASDSSGHGNDGMLMNLDAASVWVPSPSGNALAINAHGWVVVPRSPTIDSIKEAVTVSAWVYLDGTIVEFGTAMSRQLGSALNQYYHLSLGKNASTPSLFIGFNDDDLPAQPVGKEAVPPTMWTHLAGTYDGTTAILYLNGEQAATVAITGSFPLDTTDLILGGNRNNSTVTELFPGRIDELALYNRALSADEVRKLATRAPF